MGICSSDDETWKVRKYIGYQGSKIPVFKSPTIYSDKIGFLKAGDQFRVIGTKAGWLEIETGEWIPKKYGRRRICKRIFYGQKTSTVPKELHDGHKYILYPTTFIIEKMI